MAIVTCRNVGIYFHKYHRRDTAIAWVKASLGLGFLRRRPFWALRGVNLDVQEGDVLGVVGGNGAGKSTLLKILAGVYRPDEGEVVIAGRVSPVMATGKGLDPMLSGRDNFALVGAMIGMGSRCLRRVFSQAMEFAGLGDSIDTPVKYYSSGMKARLSFCLSVFSSPDVLLLDEMLETGDKDFRVKALEEMAALTKRTKATVIVSHAAESLATMCNKVLWMDKGGVRMVGPALDVLEAYFSMPKTDTQGSSDQQPKTILSGGAAQG